MSQDNQDKGANTPRLRDPLIHLLTTGVKKLDSGEPFFPKVTAARRSVTDAVGDELGALNDLRGFHAASRHVRRIKRSEKYAEMVKILSKK